ncbi:isochorismatase family cysteine hydrolase [Sporolactobacillus shoreae]|nr:isochorismatase family cysteine hydrolase [Sporolactobacillus shoreae]
MVEFIGRPALLIIDAQKEFLSSVTDSVHSVQIIGEVLQAARKNQIPVIFSKEIHRRTKVDFGRELDGDESIHCLEKTEGVEIVDPLQPIEGEYVITKRRYSCFVGTDLQILLQGLHVQTLIVCGFLTDVCVHYTCADAHQYDYFVRVIYDGVSGSSEEAHAAALKAIKYLQHDSETDSEEVIAFLNDARNREVG